VNPWGRFFALRCSAAPSKQEWTMQTGCKFDLPGDSHVKKKLPFVRTHDLNTVKRRSMARPICGPEQICITCSCYTAVRQFAGRATYCPTLLVADEGFIGCLLLGFVWPWSLIGSSCGGYVALRLHGRR